MAEAKNSRKRTPARSPAEATSAGTDAPEAAIKLPVARIRVYSPNDGRCIAGRPLVGS